MLSWVAGITSRWVNGCCRAAVCQVLSVCVRPFAMIRRGCRFLLRAVEPQTRWLGLRWQRPRLVGALEACPRAS